MRDCDHGLQIFKWSRSDLSLNIFSRNSIRDTVYLGNSETDLQVPLFKTANGQNSFAYRWAHLWNSLDSEVKKAPSVLAFKHLS